MENQLIVRFIVPISLYNDIKNAANQKFASPFVRFVHIRNKDVFLPLLSTPERRGQATAYLAHIRPGDLSGSVVQTAADHSRNTARLARGLLEPIGLGNVGYLAGLIHDAGKFKEEFQRYLQDPNGIRGSVNHTFAGCRLMLERFHTLPCSRNEDITAELIAFAAAAHHGLFDCVNDSRGSGWLHRLEKEGIGYRESMDAFLRECAGEAELDQRFGRAHQELWPAYEELIRLSGDDPEELNFYFGLLARLILSAVIDSDRQDTAAFMENLPAPAPREAPAVFWTPVLQRVEEKLARFPQDTPIRVARGKISQLCREAADRPGGIWRLSVPTGGGKTLSSLRYALAHARRWGKKRLIFTAPLLSILEQNAAVLREYLADDGIILEHHSNVLRTEEGHDLDSRELAVESWDAPVIITTLVQLLHTLFDGRTTSIRRFQSLCQSVIVIDEVQTVPPKMLSLFNLAVNFLARVCGATVVLCSATQPCLEETAHSLKDCRGDLVPCDPALWEPFRRTVITDAGRKTMAEIEAFARDTLDTVSSLLIVCNKKSQAEQLFHALGAGAEVSCHLSAAMCMGHRRKALEALNRGLAAGKKCLCVATQVIEAGVDISFDCVIRMSAGMDSVIQAAGRCNRHAEQAAPAPVYVVSCEDESLTTLREIRQAKTATLSLLDAFRRTPERFGGDLASDASITRYYRQLYRDMPVGYPDYTIPKKGTSLFELLSGNPKYYDGSAAFASYFFLNQAFALAGAAFEVFDSSTRELVVPYGGGAELIAELAGQRSPDAGYLAGWLRRAKPFTVSVYDHQLARLGNAVTEYAGIAVLAPGFYDEDTGLSTRPVQQSFLEV